jgi:virulence-associated protein VagC
VLSNTDLNELFSSEQDIQQGFGHSRVISLDDHLSILDEIPEDDELNLSQVSIDKYDKECIIAPHKRSGNTVLVHKRFKGGKILDNEGNETSQMLEESDYEIDNIDKSNVMVARIFHDGQHKAVKRSFKGGQVLDIKEGVGDKWTIGRIVIEEKDWDFKNAVADPNDCDNVIVRHKKTGYRAVIVKSFIGGTRLDSMSLEPLP